MATTEIEVIRHGETDWNVEGRIQGWLESGLNARGWAQAQALGRRYGAERKAESAEHIQVSAIYSSDLKRTMDTAAEIGHSLGLEIESDARLREWHLGVLEGMLIEEAREKAPEAMRIYDERMVDVMVPEGESIRARYERCTGCLREIAGRHAGERVVVVTHGGILDDIYRFVNGIGLDVEGDWPLYNAGVNSLRIDHCQLKVSNLGSRESGWKVVGWGDVGHLEGIGAMANWGGDSTPPRPSPEGEGDVSSS